MSHVVADCFWMRNHSTSAMISTNCVINILSLRRSDLPKSERFLIKRSMMNTICKQHVRQLYSNKMLSLQSMQKLWSCRLLRIRRPGTSFFLQELWIDLIRKQDRCMRNLLQMLSVTKYCKSGCCPINSITRADAKKSTNNDYTTRLCPDALDNFLHDYIDRKWCTSICQWDTVCTRTSTSCNPNDHTPNIATASCPWHSSSNTATVFHPKYPQHRHLGKHHHQPRHRKAQGHLHHDRGNDQHQQNEDPE